MVQPPAPPPDARRRMDLDAGDRANEIREKARQERNAEGVERVDETMRGNRVKAGIRENDIERAARGGVPFDRDA